MAKLIHGNPRLTRQIQHNASTQCTFCRAVVHTGEWRFAVRKWRLTLCYPCKRWYSRLLAAYHGYKGCQDVFDAKMVDVIKLAHDGTLAWITLAPLLIEDARRAHNKEAV